MNLVSNENIVHIKLTNHERTTMSCPHRVKGVDILNL